MAQAPNYDTLHNFEEIFEAAVADVINAASIPALAARAQDETAELQVSCVFEVGPASGSKRLVAYDDAGKPICEYERYDNCNLEIQIVANRFFDDGSEIPNVSSKLAEVRAKIRTLFRESQGALNDANLYYYRVNRIRPAGTQNGTTEKKEQDISTLRFSVDFCIMPDSWPAEE